MELSKDALYSIIFLHFEVFYGSTIWACGILIAKYSLMEYLELKAFIFFVIIVFKT